MKAQFLRESKCLVLLGLCFIASIPNMPATAQTPAASTPSRLTPELRNASGHKNTPAAPQPILSVIPIYPREQLLAGQEGSVSLKYKVSPQGAVIQSKVLDSTHISFTKAAQHALRFWKFQPLMINQEPSSSVHRQTFTFKPTADSFYSLEALPPENPSLVPFPKKGIRPAYPEQLKAQSIRGYCHMIITINQLGVITEVASDEASHLLFAESGLLTAKQWQFLPHTVSRDDQRVRLTFLFRP